MRKRNLRLAQTIVPFGVGAIYDILGESLVACDIFHWRNDGNPLRAQRLEEKLGVRLFKAAPSHYSLFGQAPGVPYARFPQWLFCPTCRNLVRWTTNMEVKGEPARCPTCKRRPQLVPMRFVMVCGHGHMTDVPWPLWTHFGSKDPAQRQCASKSIRFITRRDIGGGLESLVLECNSCKARRSLKGISSADSLKPLRIRCPGTQPWERGTARNSCEQEPQVVQRGASNVYFALTTSAIDIPPESSYAAYSDLALAIANSDEFAVLRSAPDGPLSTALIRILSDRFACPEEQIRTMALHENQRRSGSPPPVYAHASDLQSEEWRAFITPQVEQDPRDRFITRLVPLFPPSDARKPWEEELARLISQVIIATRIREVRVLTGFTRYDPDGEIVRPDLGKELDWLPAIEVFGEGVFIRLREEYVREWELRPNNSRVAMELDSRKNKSIFAKRFPRATSRFLLLHTFAHLLIRELSYRSGYSSASLKERIYARMPEDGEPQAGVFIYTAAGDVEGTLGGLARQGEPSRLSKSILGALERGSWCSIDPICGESTAQGFSSLNRAACHACTLLSETSCDYANGLLDRSFLFGTDRGPSGFFTELLQCALEDSARIGRE
jgi:hypothetical protein